MFTGIVEALGEVLAVDHHDESARIAIRGPVVAGDAMLGDSIAVNGVCLTVTAADGGVFTADVMSETLSRTGIGRLRPGSPVNLERPLRLDSRLGGHLVQGHVDGVGTVLSRAPAAHTDTVRISVPASLERYLVAKGSITVDGVSLTVSAVSAAGADSPWFEVSLIPTTLAGTTLGTSVPGDGVNLEVDVIGKYVERLLGDLVVRP